MSIINKLAKGLDRKVWQMMTPPPVAGAVAAFSITDNLSPEPGMLFLTSAAVHYFYDFREDAWINLPASGVAGTFAAGACGSYHPNGPTGTAI